MGFVLGALTRLAGVCGRGSDFEFWAPPCYGSLHVTGLSAQGFRVGVSTVVSARCGVVSSYYTTRPIAVRDPLRLAISSRQIGDY